MISQTITIEPIRKPYIERRDALANTRTGEWVKLWETDAPEEK